MGHTDFEHWLGSVVEAARLYSCPWVQILDKSLVPCDCLLPFLALTLDKSSVRYESFTIYSFNFTNWLDSVVKALRYMHAPGWNPKQVLTNTFCMTCEIHGSCKIFYYLSFMSRTTFFYHQLDLTLWLRLQDICTPGFKSRTSNRTFCMTCELDRHAALYQVHEV